MSKPRWRQAHATDLEAISAIAARIHPDLPERPDVLAEKMRLYPDGCRVLIACDEIAGYGLSHPWKQQRIPPLDALLERADEVAFLRMRASGEVMPWAQGGAAPHPPAA